MSQRFLKLDLSPQAKKTFASQFSSENYSSTAQSLLFPFDMLYTYFFRYNRLLTVDLNRGQGIDANDGSQGSAIDFTSLHPVVGAAITASFVAVAAVATYFHVRQLSKKHDENNTHGIKEKLDKATEAEKEKPQLLPIFDMNYYLAKALKTRPDLQAKYDIFALEGDHMTVTLKETPTTASTEASAKQPGWFGRIKNSVDWLSRKAMSPAWEALSLTSYSYWILYIGAGLFTGKFGVGVEGLSPLIGFGVPILVGLTYPLVKIYHYFKNRRSPQVAPATEAELTDPEAKELLENEITDPDAKLIAEKDTTSLMRSALLLRGYELEAKGLQVMLKEYGIDEPEPVLELPTTATKIDKEIATLRQGRWNKAITTCIGAIAGTYVASQYGAWVISDLLNVVANVSIAGQVAQIAIGTVMMAGAVGYGLYKAVERYFEVKGHETNPVIPPAQAQLNELSSLEQKLEQSRKNIAELEHKLSLSPIASPRYDQEESLTVATTPPTIWSTVKKIALGSISFINGVTAGAFIARVFFVKGTAIALPFVAASLSNPITIGILVGLGVAYGAFKFYQYHQERKEEHAKVLLAQRDERIQCLAQEVVISGMREKLYSAMVKKMEEPDNTEINAKTMTTQPLTTGLSHTVFARPRSKSLGGEPAIGSPDANLTRLGPPKNRAA